MRRTMSRSELMYVGEIRTRAVTVCAVRGGVDPDLLDQALSAVLADHLSLRSRIEREGDKAFLSLLEPDEIPRLSVRPQSPEVQLTEYNTPLELGGPLVRAVLLTGSDEDTLVLSVDHAVCDGRSATTLIYRLWQYYADIQDGKRPEPDLSQQWPPSIDDLLPAHTDAELDAHVRSRLERAEGAPVAALPYLAALTGARVPAQGAMTSRRLRLTEPETAGLLAFAKSAKVSVHGLVGAALLAVVRAGLADEFADHRLACVSTIDLRDRVEQTLSRDAMVPAAAWYQDLLEVPAGADLVDLGARLAGNLRTAVQRGDGALELQSLDRLAAHPDLWAASLVMTNVGAMAGPPSPAGLEIVDMTKFALSSKWNPDWGKGALLASSMTIYGRFSIELPYSAECFTAQQLDSVHDQVKSLLLEFADRAPALVG